MRAQLTKSTCEAALSMRSAVAADASRPPAWAASVVVTMPLDPWLSLRALATYSGLAVRTLRKHLDDPTHPLPHYRVGGKILVRRGEYDAWALQYRRVGALDVDRIVDDALQSLR
jgi:hypothetical protein